MNQQAWDILLKIIYIILSAVVVLLPLAALFPTWYKVIPYYRKAMKGMEKLYSSPDDEIYTKGEHGQDKEIQLGLVKKGDKGFKELLEAIRINAERHDVNVAKIILLFGDIQFPCNAKFSPNMAIIIEASDEAKTRIPIIYDPMDQNFLYNVRYKLNNWIRITTQLKMTRYALVTAVAWVVIATIYIFR